MSEDPRPVGDEAPENVMQVKLHVRPPALRAG